jgi:preprotein translocase subunit SecG
MITVILVIHLLLALSLIGVVLLQKSEGGALGMGGGGMGGFMSGRTTANLLTRTTAVVAGLFFLTSISLAILANNQRAPRSIVDVPAGTTAPAPALPSQIPVQVQKEAPPAAPAENAPAANAPAAPAATAPATPPAATAPATPPAAPAAPAEPSAPLAK